jgi:alpha-amylase
MKKYIAYGHIQKALITVVFLMSMTLVKAQKDVMLQAFYWDVPVDHTNLNGTWWDNLKNKSTDFKNIGITGIWVPSPAKGNWGIYDMGYGIYDHYDLGNYNQKGTVETRFGSRRELVSMIAAMHNVSGGQPRVEVYADIILNHIYSSEENEEVNPAVKQYVFDEAYRNATQYVPYPTNEIKWVIPAAQAGDYYIKFKGYHLDFTADFTARAYDLQIDYNNTGFNTCYSWEAEPNNGGGEYNIFPVSGQTVRAFINYQGDIDEFKVSAPGGKDIVIKLAARQQSGSNWNWARQTNGYYPFEVWYNGQNLASASLEARTNTHIFYPNHTGEGEKNYAWNYNHFHPVDANDWLGGWGGDEIIPNTKAFGNDLNTYSATVETRMKDWGAWLSEEIKFDGYRLDFVRGFQESYAANWINSLPLLNNSQRFIVGEYWGADFRIRDWVYTLGSMGAIASGFDFPLKSSLTDLCNGDAGFDMRWLNHAGMIRNNSGNALPGNRVVTFLENHDTGKEHDKWVTKDWHLGYAYMLTHEGRPCLFYPHLYGVTLVDNHDPNLTLNIPASLNTELKKLIFARSTYLNGIISVLSQTGNPYPPENAANVYVARREGNGVKDGAIVVINNSNASKGMWVDATPSGWSDWSDNTLVNAFDNTITSKVYGDGRVWVEAPARGYAIYVLATDYVAYSEP